MPGRPPETPIAARTVAGWHARRGRLLALLHDDPEGDWAWLWRVHVRITDYLIHRYTGPAHGSESVAGQGDELAAMLEQADNTLSRTAQQTAQPMDDPNPAHPRPYGNARVEKAGSLEGPAAQRLRTALHDRLSSLHATNDQRRANAPPILPTPPPKLPWYMPQPSTHRSPDRRGAPPYGIDVHLPVWLERVLLMEVSWPPRLADARPRPERATGPQPPDDGRVWVRWMTYPEDAGVELASAGVEPFDDESLALLRQAMQDDDAWDLSADEPLSEADILRLLGGGEDPDA